MELPELYRKVAFLPKRDASKVLEEFTFKNRWKENANIIDFGSGDGSTTSTVLAKYLPSSYSKIVGCDISAKMVAYANENFRSARIRAAFRSIYNSLKAGGNCLLLFLGRYPVHDVFRALSHTPKWAEDLKDVETFVSPYHDSPDPEHDVRALMTSVGFKGVQVDIYENTHTYYDEETFKNLIKAINPFHVINDRWDEFMEDYFELTTKTIKIDYELIVAYGFK